jgi:thiol-disulfide isomerase/thioredoxin
MRLAFLVSLSLLLAGAAAQESAKELHDRLAAAQKDLTSAGRLDRAKLDEFQQSVRDALAANEKLFGTGDGLYYRARLQLLARDQKAAAGSFHAYLATKPASDLAHEARVAAAGLAMGDKQAARELLGAVDAGKLSEATRRQFEQMQSQMKADETRAALHGKPAPAIPAEKVLNGDANWSLERMRGKVVVVDFWATWCPPCRAIIPDLVKLQAEHGAQGLQVVGVTRFYGNGMDFDADSTLPHGGKSVGGRKGSGKELSAEEELRVNENFIKAFAVNYPIVFTGEKVAGDSYGVTGIPTCYVIGRDGKVLGHIVGGGKANHDKLVDLITQALGGTASHKGGD